ncbi:ArsR/SmtB family transcription factor [Haloplanus litoreus]|uniref:ArsR/SmtB family transcription factor n=1 Tax=Haloplanus litoreus TaxID=767515 RepID=A0ABD6A0C6_9EURY
MTSYTPPPTPTTDEPDPDRTDEVLALLEDDYSRSILEAVHAEPRSARDLVEVCDASRATVYRRLDRLDDVGLVESWLSYDADGHHRTVFEATLDAVTVGLDADGIGVTITTDDATADGSVTGD